MASSVRGGCGDRAVGGRNPVYQLAGCFTSTVIAIAGIIPDQNHASENAMSNRDLFLPVTAVILVAGTALQPAVAYVDRAGSTAPRLQQPPTATMPGLVLHSAAPPPSKPRSLGQQFAHAIVVRTSPEKGTVAPESPGKVEVWYDAGIRNDFAALAVINSAGDRVDKRDAAIDRLDPSHVSTSVEVLPPGEYTVRYRAVSADGHIVSGAWTFEVRQ